MHMLNMGRGNTKDDVGCEKSEYTNNEALLWALKRSHAVPNKRAGGLF